MRAIAIPLMLVLATLVATPVEAHPGGTAMEWYVHGMDAYFDFGTPMTLANTPPVGEVDNTVTLLTSYPELEMWDTVPLSSSYVKAGDDNEAFLYLKSWNFASAVVDVEVKIYADSTLIASGTESLVPIYGGLIFEVHVPLDMDDSVVIPSGSTINMYVDWYDSASGAWAPGAYARGTSDSHLWGFTLDIKPATAGPPTPPPPPGGGGNNTTAQNPDAGGVDPYTDPESNATYAYGVYFGITGEDIAITGTMTGSDPIHCGWEGVSTKGGSKPYFDDASACSTTVMYEHPGHQLIRLHATNATDYGIDYAIVIVEPSEDYVAPEEIDEEGASRPPKGRAYEMDSSHNPDAGYARDRDRDAALDSADNCPLVPGGEADMDKDGYGDGCDPDMDGDGILNGDDNCVSVSNPAQVDTDGDGRGDVCSSDKDKDGFSDEVDNCPSVSNALQADLDRDGVGNVCDLDVDGDGVADKSDLFPLDKRDWADLDRDGVGDNMDADRDGDGWSNVDELYAGTDSWDPESYPVTPVENQLETKPAAAASTGGFVGWTLGLALFVVIVGIVVAVVMRPRS